MYQHVSSPYRCRCDWSLIVNNHWYSKEKKNTHQGLETHLELLRLLLVLCRRCGDTAIQRSVQVCMCVGSIVAHQGASCFVTYGPNDVICVIQSLVPCWC